MNGKKVIACAKHFVGDGNTEFGTGMNGLVDRGNTILTIEELKEKLLPGLSNHCTSCYFCPVFTRDKVCC